MRGLLIPSPRREPDPRQDLLLFWGSVNCKRQNPLRLTPQRITHSKDTNAHQGREPSMWNSSKLDSENDITSLSPVQGWCVVWSQPWSLVSLFSPPFPSALSASRRCRLYFHTLSPHQLLGLRISSVPSYVQPAVRPKGQSQPRHNGMASPLQFLEGAHGSQVHGSA